MGTMGSKHCPLCEAAFRGDWTVCVNCSESIADFLGMLYRGPDIISELLVTATRQSQMVESVGSRNAETPLVFNARAVAHLRALTTFLRTYTRHYELAFYRTDHESSRLSWGLARFLHEQVSHIVKAPDADDFARTLYRLVDQAIEIIDRPPDEWFAGPCPTCQADLYATEGAGQVRCKICCGVFDVAQQRERLLLAVDDVLATAAEISRAVHLTGVEVTPSKITNLYHRGKLVRHGRNRAGDHLYRMGDVLAVVRP